LCLGGDQRDRDRAKAQKKTADKGKGHSQTPKDKETYGPHFSLRPPLIYRHAEKMREKQRLADERKAAESAAAKKK
jgi:hypothetical protein